METDISKQSETKQKDKTPSLKFFFASFQEKKHYFLFILPSPFSLPKSQGHELSRFFIIPLNKNSTCSPRCIKSPSVLAFIKMK